MTIGGGAGVLSLNNLYHHIRDLYEYYKDRHRGLFAALIYNDADEDVKAFVENHLDELISLSEDIVLFAPASLPDQNDEFIKWWEDEYEESSDMMTYLRGKEVENYYKTSLNAIEQARDYLGVDIKFVPCVVFFSNYPHCNNVVVSLHLKDNEFEVVQSLRAIFSVANNVNKKIRDPDKSIVSLRKELTDLIERMGQTNTNPSIKINVSFVKISGKVFDAIFG